VAFCIHFDTSIEVSKNFILNFVFTPLLETFHICNTGPSCLWSHTNLRFKHWWLGGG